jgi:hypothetical protein
MPRTRKLKRRVPEVSIMRHSYQHHKPRAQIHPNLPQKDVCLRLLPGIRHLVESSSSHLARLKLQKMFTGRWSKSTNEPGRIQHYKE